MVSFWNKKKKTKNKAKPKVKRAKPKARKIKKVKVKRVKPKVKKAAKTKVKKLKVKKQRTVNAAKEVKPSFNKMPDEKAFLLLKKYRIGIPAYAFCKNEKDLAVAIKKIGFPCVMKVSGSIVHKTDVNGVRKSVNSEEEATKSFNELMKIKGCDKVLVQKMVDGYELIVGSKKDPQFNRVVALGAGGIFTEFLRDVSFRVIPLSKTDAEEMINEVKFSDLILNGFRGQKPADKASIIDVILSVSRIMETNPKIKEIDINPLFATSEKAIAADVRIILE